MPTLHRYVDVPPHAPTDFDHGDVHRRSGRVFIAHTAPGRVEVIDAEGRVLASIPDCPEASGVLCAQETGVVFAAARGAGSLLTIDVESLAVVAVDPVGARPNGLAWDPGRERVLVADVQDDTARLVVPGRGVIASAELTGRPRWCVFDRLRDRFLVNIREPASIAVLAAETLALAATFPVAVRGPHGLDLDPNGDRLFVACDGGSVVFLDAGSGSELGHVPIPGEPDAIWFNSQKEQLYVAISKPGVLSVVDTKSLTVAAPMATEEGAGTTAFDAERQRLHVFLPHSCRVAVYDA